MASDNVTVDKEIFRKGDSITFQVKSDEGLPIPSYSILEFYANGEKINPEILTLYKIIPQKELPKEKVITAKYTGKYITFKDYRIKIRPVMELRFRNKIYYLIKKEKEQLIFTRQEDSKTP